MNYGIELLFRSLQSIHTRLSNCGKANHGSRFFKLIGYYNYSFLKKLVDFPLLFIFQNIQYTGNDWLGLLVISRGIEVN